MAFFGRLKKLWRFFKGREEFDLTEHESAVFSYMLRILRNVDYKDTNAANLAFYNYILSTASYRARGLNERNLDDAMKSLASKLLKQTDYE